MPVKAKVKARGGTQRGPSGVKQGGRKGVERVERKVEGKANRRVLKRNVTPILTNFTLKQEWVLSDVTKTITNSIIVPTRTFDDGVLACRITPTCPWFRELCFGRKYFVSLNSRAIRETLARLRVKSCTLDEGDGVHGRAALDCSESEDEDDEDDEMDKDGKDGGEVPSGWVVIDVDGVPVTVSFVKKLVMFLKLEANSIAALLGLVRETRAEIKLDYNKIRTLDDPSVFCNLQDLLIPADEGRILFKHGARNFVVQYKGGDSNKIQKYNTHKLPHRQHSGAEFTTSEWKVVVQGFVYKCRSLFNRLDMSGDDQYNEDELRAP